MAGHTMQSSGSKTLVKRFLGFSVASWISAVVNFALAPIITRVIAPGELGKIDMFVTLCNIFVYTSTLGMHQSYMRFFNDLPSGFTKNSLLAYSVKVSMVGALASGIVCIVGHSYFSSEVLGRVTFLIPVLMTLFILASGFLDVIKTKPRMYGNVLQYSVIVVLISVGTKAAYLSFGYTGSVITTIVVITAVNVLLMLVYLFMNRVAIFINIRRIERGSKTTIFQYALPTVPIMLLANINTSIPKLLLSRFCDSTTLGIYAGALTLVSIITLVQAGVNVFWAPYVFANYKTKQQEIQKIHIIITFGIVLCGLGLLLCQDAIMHILGGSYRSGRTFYALLLSSPIFYTIGETVGIGISIKKKTYWNIITTASALLCNFVLGRLLIPAYGNIGAAMSVMAAAAVMLVLKAFIGEKYFTTIQKPFKTWSAPILYAICAVLSLLFADVPLVRYLSLTGAVAIMAIIYHSEVRACFRMVLSFFKGNVTTTMI